MIAKATFFSPILVACSRRAWIIFELVKTLIAGSTEKKFFQALSETVFTIFRNFGTSVSSIECINVVHFASLYSRLKVPS